MATNRTSQGRFAPKPKEELSPAYRSRLERAEKRGKSLTSARGHAVKPLPMWRTREVQDKEAYRKSLTVLSQMRQGQSLYEAARAEQISPDTVRRYVGAALVRESSGRYRAKPSDRFARRMKFLDARGLVTVEPANSREASKLAQYWDAVNKYINNNDAKPLWRFRRQQLRVTGKIQLPFLTSLDDIYQLARAGELSFEDLYALSA
ncbi:MAG: hypothetical protein ACLQUY_05240 [Ktedonobacterales bacterium]